MVYKTLRLSDLLVVNDDSRGVSEDEDAPDEDVPRCWSASLGEPTGELAEEGLAEEGDKGRVSEDPHRGGDDVLVSNGGQEEHYHHRLELGPASLDERTVDMFETPPVYWQVPQPPELLQVGRVPPRMKEHPVLAASQLRHQLEERHKDEVEDCEPGYVEHNGEKQKSKMGPIIRYRIDRC